MKPNTFIIGAPKCGTTSMFQYLCEHPQVFGSDPKEPTFFASDFPDFREIKTKEEYLGLFEQAQPQHKIILEASAMYMYSQDAIKHIKAFNPEAKLIAMLRNPVDLVHSYHSQLLYSRDEFEINFEKAWNMNELRSYSKALSKLTREPKFLLYNQMAKLGEQLERVLHYFPKQQVFIIFFEDFNQDTESVHKETLCFLDLPPHPTDFSALNKNKKQRLQWIANFTSRPPQSLVQPYLNLKKMLGLQNKTFGFLQPIMRMNEVETRREKLSDEVQQKIIDNYRDDIKKLASITGRNLDHWLKVKQSL